MSNSKPMTPEQFVRVREIFDAARELDHPRRAAFLEEKCAGDATLRTAVEHLLGESVTTGFMAKPLFDPGESGGPMHAVPDQLGRYRIIAHLGEGGFADVYLAEQADPLRRVAIKVVKPGMDSRAVIARFGLERQALASMDHPYIACVFDAGTTPAGRPYFVMEYVAGLPITECCDHYKLDLRQRLALFAEVCDAVNYAHQRGFIHRDLKPTNILAAMVGDRPAPKVIDFGVAKSLTGPVSGHTLFTSSGQMVGTPEYMSPEQADPASPDVDARCDVYSLGVLLYEMLAGAPPIDRERFHTAGISEVQRLIREEPAPRPSSRVAQLGGTDDSAPEARRTTRAALIRTLASELEWIPLKAMRKERAERYRTPAELADDIRRYLGGRPLLAAPESGLYRLRKFVRRERGVVISTAAIILAVAGLVVTLSVVFTRSNLEQDTRDLERRLESERNLRGQREQDLADLTARTGIPVVIENLRTDFPDAARGMLDKSRVSDNGWARRFCTVWADHYQTAVVGRSGAPVLACAYADASTLLGVGDGSGLGKASTGEHAFATCLSDLPSCGSLCVAPAGGRAAVCGDDGVVRILDLADPQNPALLTQIPVTPDPKEPAVLVACLSADGSRVAVRHAFGAAPPRAFDCATGRELPVAWPAARRGLPSVMTRQSFAWAGNRLLACIDGGGVIVGGLDGRAGRLLDHKGGVPTHVVADPKGDEILLACEGGLVRGVSLAGAREPRTLTAHSAVIVAMALSPDGGTLATAADDGQVRLWNVETFARRSGVAAQSTPVQGIVLAPGAARIAILGADGLVRCFGVRTPPIEYFGPRPSAGAIVGIAVPPPSPLAPVAVAYEASGRVQRWSVDDMSAQGEAIAVAPAGSRVFAASPDGSLAAARCGPGEISWWETAKPEEQKRLVVPAGPVPGDVSALCFDRGGHLLAGTNAGAVLDFDCRQPMRAPRTLQAAGPEITALAMNPDSTKLAAADASGALKCWAWSDPAAPDRVIDTSRRNSAPERLMRVLAWHPDGELLVAGTQDGRLRVWKVPAFEAQDAKAPAGPIGVEILAPQGEFAHRGPIGALCFTHSPVQLISGGDGQLVVWETAAWRRLGTVDVRLGPITSLVKWSGDLVLLAGDESGRLAVIRAAAPWTVVPRNLRAAAGPNDPQTGAQDTVDRGFLSPGR